MIDDAISTTTVEDQPIAVRGHIVDGEPVSAGDLLQGSSKFVDFVFAQQ
jgi:hypothetical protein